MSRDLECQSGVRIWKIRERIARLLAPWMFDDEDYSDVDLNVLYGDNPDVIEIKWRPDQDVKPTNPPFAGRWP